MQLQFVLESSETSAEALETRPGAALTSSERLARLISLVDSNNVLLLFAYDIHFSFICFSFYIYLFVYLLSRLRLETCLLGSEF